MELPVTVFYHYLDAISYVFSSETKDGAKENEVEDRIESASLGLDNELIYLIKTKQWSKVVQKKKGE